MMCKKKAIIFKTHTSLLPLWPARMFPFPDKSMMEKQANVMRTLHVYWIQHKPLSVIMDLFLFLLITHHEHNGRVNRVVTLWCERFQSFTCIHAPPPSPPPLPKLICIYHVARRKIFI